MVHNTSGKLVLPSVFSSRCVFLLIIEPEVHGLTGLDLQVPVLQGRPAFYQEAVRVIIRAADVAQVTFRYQAPEYRTGGANNALGSIAAKRIR